MYSSASYVPKPTFQGLLRLQKDEAGVSRFACRSSKETGCWPTWHLSCCDTVGVTWEWGKEPSASPPFPPWLGAPQPKTCTRKVEKRMPHCRRVPRRRDEGNAE